MSGTKAVALDAFAATRGLAMTRFDYSGHGASGGRFEDGTISRWLDEAVGVFRAHTQLPAIVVGSSMGGWLSLLLADRLRADPPGQAAVPIAGLVLIAPAIDMTRDLMEARITKAQKRELASEGEVSIANQAGETLVITRALLEDGARHLFGDRLVEPGCPVHILQGELDRDVPWRHAAKLASRIPGDDVVFTLIKDGDHRLSRPQDIERILAAVAGIVAEAVG
ncbi:MAG: alpha/beta fold hydrolase [Bauldia sp.]